jgi:hypothetical protein
VKALSPGWAAPPPAVVARSRFAAAHTSCYTVIYCNTSRSIHALRATAENHLPATSAVCTAAAAFASAHCAASPTVDAVLTAVAQFIVVLLRDEQSSSVSERCIMANNRRPRLVHLIIMMVEELRGDALTVIDRAGMC